jgi:hypothetical protein
MKRAVFVAVVIVLVAAYLVPASANDKTSPAALRPSNTSPHALSWEGTLPPAGTDSFWFVAELGVAREARVTSWIHWGTSEDLAVAIYDGTTRVGSADADPGEDEIVSYTVLNGRRYEVRVTGNVNAQTAFQGFTWVRSVAGRAFAGPGRLRYPKKDLFATVDVPINVVFVGFDPSEVDAQRQAVLDQLPPSFRPVIRIGSTFWSNSGAVRRELGSGGRQARATANALLQPISVDPRVPKLLGRDIRIEPLEYRYHYKFITAPESYSRDLFAAAKAATTPGDYALAFDRTFIEGYNARAGGLRGPGSVVAPKAPVDFIDGFRLEDWVAAHPPAGLDFDLTKPARGYTYFVMDSFRPSYAAEYFNPNHYHNFRVMNELTTDPDSGVQNGFDWARVWGGRYRFLMLDVGAAPNSWEAPVTTGNTKIFRLQGDGDSSAYDPPIWHYPGQDVAPFYERLGEDVQYAIWMRFTRGYLYRPRAYDKYILAANTWHDFDAYTPWPSRLESLYKDQLVLQRYKELLPYVNFEAFSRFKYLAKGDPEQTALDEGKNASVSRLPVPFAVNTNPTKLLIDRNRATYAPLEPGVFTIPVINAVFPSLYTWALPVIVGGIAEGEGGEAWGQLQNVNNRTKWPGASATVTDSQGVEHAPTFPDSRQEGIDNVARFGFTATALHEAGHFLGLSHNHDAVAYDWRFGSAGDATGYYSAIDWMYTTTATPMGYGWEYNRFEVMDKDNVWIGHALEWLTTAQDNLADAYAALDGKGFTKATSAVLAAQNRAEAMIGDAVANIRGGEYLAAVVSARQAARLSERVVATAATSVLGKRVVANPKPGIRRLPATGLDDPAALPVVTLVAAILLGGFVLRRYRFTL